MTEIERKFLVKNTNFINEAHKQSRIVQGYLTTDPERSVRIRIKNEQGFITIKGCGNTSGTTRFEWEKEIPLSEAEQLIRLCLPFPIEKTRHEISFGGFVFEVDVFHGNHNGLILAEIELSDENQSFERPHWLGEEVTGNPKYYNSYLSKNHFSD